MFCWFSAVGRSSVFIGRTHFFRLYVKHLNITDMINVDYDSLYQVENKYRLLCSHWTTLCLMVNCDTDFQQVEKEHKLFTKALEQLHAELYAVKQSELAHFAAYQRTKDLESLYG